MKVVIPSDAKQAKEVVAWLDTEVGPWREGHWRVTTARDRDGRPLWEVELDEMSATLFLLRWA